VECYTVNKIRVTKQDPESSEGNNMERETGNKIRFTGNDYSESDETEFQPFVDNTLKQLREKLDNKCDFVSQLLKDRSGDKITTKYSDYEYSFYMYFESIPTDKKYFAIVVVAIST